MSETRVACPDCTVDCDGQRHEINYCPAHGAGPVLLETLEKLRGTLPEFGPMDGTIWILIDNAIDQAKALHKEGTSS